MTDELPYYPVEDDFLACHECDLLVKVPPLENAQMITCPRCHYVLTEFGVHSYAQALSYAVAAMVFVLIAMSYDFIIISTATGKTHYAIPQSLTILLDLQQPALAIIFFLTALFLPVLVLLLAAYLLAAVQLERKFPFLIPAFKAFFFFKAWSMTEVFLAGAVVSLIKIAKLATVELGPGFIAYCLFSVFVFVAIRKIDRQQLWSGVQRLIYHA